MRVKYVGPFDAVEGPGFQAKSGETIEVADDLGASLAEQSDWQEVASAKETTKTDTKKEG